MWESLGADGWVVCICVAEVMVPDNRHIIMCLGMQSNLGSEATFIVKYVLKGHEKQLKC